MCLVGSVDDGKSTLLGRILHDSRNLLEDQMVALKKASKSFADGELDFSLVSDGLKAEREQGITIDVAYRYFGTAKRSFIVADTPGHEQYTRNMATGSSTASLAILLVDARHGVLTQTRRHSFIASLLGIPRLLIAINKMDLVDYSEERFEEIKREYTDFVAKLGITELKFVPVSALRGDNVVERSARTPWYGGESILDYLENVYVEGDRNLVDFRFPVQTVIRPHQDYRGFAGQIASGCVRVGDEILVLPSHQRTRVKAIDTFEGELPEAYAPLSVCVRLEDEVDVSRGDMLVRPHNIPVEARDFEAMVVWFHETPLDPTRPILIRQTSRTVKARFEAIRYRIDVNTLRQDAVTRLERNEIGRVVFHAAQPLFLDAYRKNRMTGGFILIDPISNATLAAGMVIDRLTSDQLAEEKPTPAPRDTLCRHEGDVTQAMRETRLGQKGVTVWLTGLPSSGKSTLAVALEQLLFTEGLHAVRLDGDNLRFGLNSDLGFSKADRRENIRRVAETAKLFNDAGLIAIAALVSPYAEDRERARATVGADRFVEIFVKTPLATCEARDPKGLYRKARAGELDQFTGIGDPYEAPEAPALVVDMSTMPVDEAVAQIARVLRSR